jgi:hypothetical protein
MQKEKMMKKYFWAVILVVFLLAAGNGLAEEKAWSLEVTPYLWMAGIDGDVTARDREVNIDVGFDDLFDRTEAAASFLVVGEINRFVLWGQFDFFMLSSDEADAEDRRLPDRITVDNDTTIIELAFGYRFDGFWEGQTIEVMAGMRYTEMENELKIDGLGSFKSDRDLIDPMLVVRPCFPLFPSRITGLYFNPTLAIGGGGDSDFIYELQPQIEYMITDHLLARIGYRRLYYDVDGDRGSFDGAFHGFIIGLGGKF